MFESLHRDEAEERRERERAKEARKEQNKHVIIWFNKTSSSFPATTQKRRLRDVMDRFGQSRSGPAGHRTPGSGQEIINNQEAPTNERTSTKAMQR